MMLMLSHVRSILLLLLTLLGLTLSSCGKEAQAPSAVNEEDQATRLQRAESLWLQAQQASPPDKIPLLRRLVGTYPEFGRIELAHLNLVMYLQDHSVNKIGESHAATTVFGKRFPNSLEVSECYSWIARRYRELSKEDAAYKEKEVELLEEWDAWLRNAIQHTKDSTKLAVLHQGRGHICGWRGNSQKAIPHLEKSLTFECTNLRERQRAQLELARLLADSEGSKERIMGLFEQAILLAQQGANGATEEAIREEMERYR